MKGILLAYELLHQKEMKLNVGDLVIQNDNEYYDNNYYNIEKITDNQLYCYYIKSLTNGELMNFARNELVKCHYAFFDYDKYYKEGKRVLLGALSFDDMEYIKLKKLNDLELGYSQLNTIKVSDIIGMEFNGSIKEKTIIEDSDPNFPMSSILTYFKINKPN